MIKVQTWQWEPDPEYHWREGPVPGMHLCLNLLHEAGEIEAGTYYVECYW